MLFRKVAEFWAEPCSRKGVDHKGFGLWLSFGLI